MHADAFADRDGKKCYYPDNTVTRDYDDAVDFCEDFTLGGFGDWLLVNPRNFREDSRIREALGAFE